MTYSTSIPLLATELYSAHGGVQAYMRRIAEILTEYNRDRGGALDCVSLLDSNFVAGYHTRPVSYGVFAGANRSKFRFVQRAVSLGWKRRPGTAVVGHLGLGPVAWALKRMDLVKSFILVLHGVEAWVKANGMDRVAARAAARIVATTRFTADEFCRLNGIAPECTRIIPLAVCESRVAEEAGRDCARGSCQLKVLTVSRLASIDGYKGIDVLIDAVASVRARNIDVDLTIVGGGDDRPRLEQRARDLGLNGAVLFAGPVPDERLVQLYRDCDVFAMPSKGEGFGIVFLEAMRYGKPCIGGNHGGTPEIVSHGEDGYLVDYGNVGQVADCLIALAENPALRDRLGANALRSVQAKYLYPRMRDGWFRVLEEVADSE